MLLPKMILRLSQSTANRVRDLFHLLTTPGDPKIRPVSTLSKADAAKMVDDGNAVRVTDASDTTGWCSAKTLIEEKADGDRRRVIFWPKEQNAAVYASGFKSAVDLEHVSAYLDAARFDYGGTRDLKVGFWQVPIEKDARRALRFTDVEGNVYEPTRLPMGHCVAVDIMQILTQVIAGDKTVVKPEFADRMRAHVWVDGFRYAGSRAEVSAALARADDRAAEFKATWKATTPAEQRYDFIGVEWNHAEHSVRVAEKTHKKLQAADIAKLTIGDLEQFVGRLIFAAGVTRIPLAQFYFAMKIARREANRVDRGEVPLSEPATIPPSVAENLTNWRAAVNKRLVIKERSNNKPAVTLFSDASEQGWGAVLVDDSGSVIGSYGQRWSTTEAKDHINALELKALQLAIGRFLPVLSTTKRLTVRVDNTTTLATVARGATRSENLVPLVAAVTNALKQANVATEVGYVKSADNPADGPSRGLTSGPLTPAANRHPTMPTKIARRA